VFWDLNSGKKTISWDAAWAGNRPLTSTQDLVRVNLEMKKCGNPSENGLFRFMPRRKIYSRVPTCLDSLIQIKMRTHCA
jgi:hypothetical protein